MEKKHKEITGWGASKLMGKAAKAWLVKHGEPIDRRSRPPSFKNFKYSMLSNEDELGYDQEENLT